MPGAHYTNYYTNVGNLAVNPATCRVVSLAGTSPIPTRSIPRTSDVLTSAKFVMVGDAHALARIVHLGMHRAFKRGTLPSR